MRFMGLVLAGWSVGFGTAILTKPWWWEDAEVRAWIASGACCCPHCKKDRKLIEAAHSDGVES